MRTVMATVLVLFAAGFVASQAGLPTKARGGNSTPRSATTRAADDGWRRTNHGWERCDHWQRKSPVQVDHPVKKTVHPMALAGVQVLAVTGLWLLTRAARRRHHEITPRTGGEHARSRSARSAGA
jgi:hypothetical protein